MVSLNGREEIEKVVRRAIEVYNRYRVPEAIAELIEVSDDRIVVRFSGSFCHTCGVVDWIEDLKYVLEDLGIESELIEVMEFRDDDVRIGVFKMYKKLPEEQNRG